METPPKLMLHILLERAARRRAEWMKAQKKGAPDNPERPRTKEKKHDRHSSTDEKMPIG